MAIANATTITRLNTCVDNNGVDLIGLSKIPEAIARLEQESFDVILIDSLLEEAGKVCHRICEIAHAPIALLVKGPEANWQKLGGWEVDGFVPESSGKIELLARMKAISRRGIRAYRSQ